MSGTDAAATLSLKINTHDARADLEALKNEYIALRAAMREGLPKLGGSSSGLASAELNDAKAKYASLQKQLDATKSAFASLSQEFDGFKRKLMDPVGGNTGLFANVTKAGYELQGLLGQIDHKVELSSSALKRMLKSAEMAGSETIKAAQVALSEQVRQGNQIVAAYARRNELIQALDLKRYEDAAAAEARLKSIQESRDKQTYDAEVAKYARRNELIQQLDVENYNARAASAARLKALQESRDKQMYDASVAAFEKQTALERKYILSSELSRVKAALDARKLIDGGYRGNLSAEFAPQTLLMASTNSAANLADKVKALGGAVAQNATHQAHWNTLANEGNAAARGLAGSLGGLWLTYGSLVPLVAAAAIASSLKNVFTIGKNLEYEFTYIQAITNGTVVSVNDFSEAIKGSMAAPVEAAKGLRILAQAGLEVGEAMVALPSVLKLATVGEVDLAGAALSATAIMHTFGMSVNDISHIGDSLATAARLSATSVKQMMEAMKQASSVSNVFGVSLHETEAALATLANRGIEGSAAGTAIRNMVKELSSPATDKAAYALQQYGIQIFNADGSAKKFTENLQQLADVTSVMTKQTKARFLEDMFNERGAKAANILLSDLEKMKSVLKELETSSSGLGFMSEAQIRISQSTEGMIKTLGASISTTFGEVFQEVKPQIDSLIHSVATLVSSSEFKQYLTSLAEAVANFTLFLREHSDAVISVIAAYAGFKVLGTVGSAVIGVTGTFLAFSSAAGTAVPVLTALGALLSGPVAIGLGLAAVAAATYTIKQAGLDETQKLVVQSAKELTEAQSRLNQSLSDGLSALTKSNDLQAERIRLLREGKSAADAAASSMDNLGYSSAKANKSKIDVLLTDAKNRLAAPEFAGEDINFNPSKQFESAWQAVQDLTVESKKASSQLEASASDSIRAGMEGRRKSLQDVQEKAHAEVEIQNKKFDAIVKRASLAATELSEGKFYGKPETQEARKKTLQADIARGAAAERFQPLDPKLAESDATKVELARRESFLSENSLGYERKPKAPKTGSGSGSNRGELKDARSILSENLSSALKQEQIQLGREVIGIETQLAAQTISATVAQENKNAATLTSLENEKKLIEQYLQQARAMKDKVETTKFENDLSENALKIEKQRQQANLDSVKARTADSNSINDSILSSQRYAEGLQFEAALLGTTALETAHLRAEREALLALENLSVRESRKQVTPDVADQERAAINANRDALKADAEFKESWLGGWSEAFDAHNKRATSAAQSAKDSFAAMASSMEDALVTFVTTGKLNFASFAKSLIADIARIEARALMSKVLSGGGGSSGLIKGAIGLVSGLFGGGGGTVGGTIPGVMTNGVAIMGGTSLALGGVVSGSPSLHAYANTVQTSPKTFAYENLHGFAKGGVFAEAGPEAVMPLTRDSRGRLGVRSQGGGDGRITIINQTTGRIDRVSEKTLSTGERALIIEEAVATTAAQFADPNSKTSRSMHRTFNLQRNR